MRSALLALALVAAATSAAVPQEVADLAAQYNCSNIKTDLRGALTELDGKLDANVAAQKGNCQALRKTQQSIFNDNTKHWKDERDFAFAETVAAAKVEIAEVKKVFADNKAVLVGAMTIASEKLAGEAGKVPALRKAKAHAFAAQNDALIAKKEGKAHAERVKQLSDDALTARHEAQTKIKELKDGEARVIFEKGTGATESTHKKMLKECDAAYDEVDRMIAQTRKVITQLSEIWDRIKENCIPNEGKAAAAATSFLEMGSQGTKLRSSGSCATLHRRAAQYKATLDAGMAGINRAAEAGAMSLLEVSSGGDPVGEMQKILTKRLVAGQTAKTACYDVLQVETTQANDKYRVVYNAVQAESKKEFEAAIKKVTERWMPNVTAAVAKSDRAALAAKEAEGVFKEADKKHGDAASSKDAASAAYNVTRDELSNWIPGAEAKRNGEVQKIKGDVVKAKADGEKKWQEVSTVHRDELTKAVELINTECEKGIQAIGREKDLITSFRSTIGGAKIKPPPAAPKPETLDCDKKITAGVCCRGEFAQCMACKAGFTSQREFCADQDRKNCEVSGCALCNPKCGRPVPEVQPVKVGCKEESDAVDAVKAEQDAQDALSATVKATTAKLATTKATCGGEAFDCEKSAEADKPKCLADKDKCDANVAKIEVELTKVQKKLTASKSEKNNLTGRIAKRNEALADCLLQQHGGKKAE